VGKRKSILWWGRDFPASPSCPISGEVLFKEHYCGLHRSIANFYLTELQRVYAEQRWNGILPFAYAKRFHNQVSECSATLLKFFLSAAIGEARHYTRRADTEDSMEGMYNTESVDPVRWHKIREKRARAACSNYAYKTMKKVLGVSVIGSGEYRESIYKFMFPMDLWDFILENLRLVYSGCWHGSYGGPKWLAGVEAAKPLFDSYLKGDFKGMVSHYDRLINLTHNCGLMFDKFDCGTGFLKDLLTTKRGVGSQGFLKEVARLQNCIAGGTRINDCSNVIWTAFPGPQKARCDSGQKEWENGCGCWFTEFESGFVSDTASIGLSTESNPGDEEIGGDYTCESWQQFLSEWDAYCHGSSKGIDSGNNTAEGGKKGDGISKLCQVGEEELQSPPDYSDSEQTGICAELSGLHSKQAHGGIGST